MLDLIRKKQKTILVKVVFWTLIATFVGTIFLIWGKGSDQGGAGDPATAATVNGKRISFDEYQNAYSNLYRMYQNVYQEKFTPALENQLGLRKQALDALVEQSLLLQEADRLDLSVSHQELVNSIATIPAFQEDGAFNRDRYLKVLAAQRLNPEAFEKMQERQLLVDKVRKKIEEGVAVTDEAILQEFRDRNEKINVAFLQFSPDQFTNRVVVDPAALQTFFKEHQEEFRLPDRVALRYIRFLPSRYAAEVTFDEGELDKHYRRHLDRFEIPEQVQASHILLRVQKDAGDEMKKVKRKLATEILEKAKGGQDFAQLARTYSEDPGSAAKGGNLGLFPRGTMVASFEEAAFSLAPGQISDVVETPFGYHIIKVEKHTEPGVRPLAEVAEEVKVSLRGEKAQQLAYEKAMDAYNINRKEGNLEKAAAANGLKMEETPLFDQKGNIEPFGQAPDVIGSAFTLQTGEMARPINLSQEVVLFAVKERQESRLPQLSEVRDAVEQMFRQKKAAEMAQQAAETALAAIRKGTSLKEIARGQKVEETGFVTRSNGSFLPGLGNSEEIAKAAFALTPQKPAAEKVFEESGNFIVMQLKERQETNMDGLDQNKREELRAALLSKQKTQAVEKQLQDLRDKAEITISPTIASTLQGENS